MPTTQQPDHEPDDEQPRGPWAWFKTQVKEGRIARSGAVLVMLVLVLLPLAVVMLTVWGGLNAPTRPEDVSVAALKTAAVGVLAFLPGWLYVRFLGQRAGALWNEYVLNLHRMSWDEPGFLPEPPCSSAYYRDWVEDRRDWCPKDAEAAEKVNIYQQKFDAYYGRSVSSVSPQDDFTVRTDMMFPVFLATAVLATGWTAVLWDDTFATSPSSVWDLLKFAFVGAYIFTIQSLIRRFFQSDLRASAYAALLVRFIVSLSVTVALVQVLDVPTTTAAAVAFVVGIFPAVALQALKRVCHAVLGVVVPPSTSDYPLDQIDGLDLWYQDRLMEEGIEDMQNLATASLVDVMLHCRVPVNRLVDWVDQAHLYLHLDHAETGRRERRAVDKERRGNPGRTGIDQDDKSVASDRVRGSATSVSRAGTRTRIALRQLGIRTATDFLNVFPDEAAVEKVDARESGIDTFQLRMLRRALSQEKGLVAVWNWRHRGVRYRSGHEGAEGVAGHEAAA